MIELTAVCIANFANIFLRAFQQRNVAFMHYRLVLPTSSLMALMEVGIWGVIVRQSTSADTFADLIPLVVAIAVGGGTGCIASMYLHHRYVKEKIV